MALPQQRSAQGVVRFYNFLPRQDSFLDQVLRGLAQPQKSLPSRYLHDTARVASADLFCVQGMIAA